jgi:hypothetical protein
MRGIVREHGLRQSDLQKTPTKLFIKQIATSRSAQINASLLAMTFVFATTLF